mgnify:CR=1 FL=1
MNCVMSPCGHQVCCSDCGNRLLECPLCKQSCTAMRIFKSWFCFRNFSHLQYLFGLRYDSRESITRFSFFWMNFEEDFEFWTQEFHWPAYKISNLVILIVDRLRARCRWINFLVVCIFITWRMRILRCPKYRIDGLEQCFHWKSLLFLQYHVLL